MKKIAPIFQSLHRFMIIPAVFWLEFLFHLWVSGSFTPSQNAMILGFSLVLGGVLNLPAVLLPQKISKWYCAVVIFLCTAIMMAEYMIGNAYHYYMRPAIIANGTVGVLSEYGNVVLSMIGSNWLRILAALIPFLLVLLSPSGTVRAKYYAAASLACCLGGFLLGTYGLAGGMDRILSKYDFNSSVKKNGLILSMYIELSGRADQAVMLSLPTIHEEPPTVPATVPEETEPPQPETEAPQAETETPQAETEPETVPETEPTEPPKVYQPHVLPQFDFKKLTEESSGWLMPNIYGYLAAQEPELENDYTGLFAGKNLIFICAEAFNYKVIDPELTPTLYRLANLGIKFTNYYQPLWTGATSGGELVNLSGLAMNGEMIHYSSQKPFNTIGRMLMNQGYFSRAYHNHGFTYYDRYVTHEDLGYEKFIGIGNGLEEGIEAVWPESDLELFDFTVPQYIDNQPFSIYYMTVSGHSLYNRFGHAQASKNWEAVEDLPYSDTVKAYLAANLELEKGLSSLVSSLEEAGIAEDTVIVLVPDHYPYGLGIAWENDHDCLAELYGVEEYDIFQRDQNTLIIWCSSIESSFLEIDEPVCSVDILPTLSNLFGLEYDSRLSVGRDVFGTQEAISFWPDYSWVTEYAKYDASHDKLTLLTDEPLPDGYTSRITETVTNKINFSKLVQLSQLFTTLGEKLEN